VTGDAVSAWRDTMTQLESVSPYTLDRSCVRTSFGGSRRLLVLRFAAGNFYVNDSPTGAVVGQHRSGAA